MDIEIQVREAASDLVIRATPAMTLRASEDPLLIVQAKVEIAPIVFPRPGTYLFELWSGGSILAELPFKVRDVS